MGEGVFAKRDITRGEFVFAERPLLVFPDRPGSGRFDDLLEAAIARLSPEKQADFRALAHVVRLPNRVITISAGEMDDPCLLNPKKVHIFRRLINMQVDKIFIASRNQLQNDRRISWLLEYDVGDLVLPERILQVPLTRDRPTVLPL